MIAIVPLPGAMGSMYAHLFENTRTGLARNLYWSVTVPCTTVDDAGDTWQTSVTCEWLTWPMTDWTGLDGASAATLQQPAQAECSFYMAAHHPVSLAELTLRAIPATTRFMVHVRGTADVDGVEGVERPCAFSFGCEVAFEGLIVVPDNLQPPPSTATEAAAVLAPFIGLAHLDAPHRDRFRYVFAPRVPPP